MNRSIGCVEWPTVKMVSAFFERGMATYFTPKKDSSAAWAGHQSLIPAGP